MGGEYAFLGEDDAPCGAGWRKETADEVFELGEGDDFAINASFAGYLHDKLEALCF